jgi:hypothetical protein
MYVKSTIIDPTRLEFDLTPHWNPLTPYASITYKDTASIEVHGANDEQIAVAFDTGLIESFRVIVDRADNRQPFIAFDVVLPGVVIKYFWEYSGAHDASKEHVLDRFVVVMRDCGVGVHAPPDQAHGRNR